MISSEEFSGRTGVCLAVTLAAVGGVRRQNACNLLSHSAHARPAACDAMAQWHVLADSLHCIATQCGVEK